MALAVDLTPYHVDRKIRLWLPTGAMVAGTLRTLDARVRSYQEGKKSRRALVITVTFDELTHEQHGAFGGGSYTTHTQFEISPTDRFEEGL
ncbi:hypothetical protein AB4Z38_06905 [Arthrobacter sp. 2RAF6]|uniref:hypothetical protein n=1 Tax=Arthrobacter sp. 2RAF6 TaxID=3233002 RepID=UPI003F8EF9DE